MKLDLDFERFWADDLEAHKFNCFNPDAVQVAMGIRMSDECVFAELGEEGEPWGYTEPFRRQELNKRYNEKALKIVGRKLLNESDPLPADSHFPGYRQIGEVFGGQYVFDGKTTWLRGSMESPEDLKRKLYEIDNMDLRSFILPSNWESEKKRVYEKYGRRPSQFRGVRGPVTLATSVFGVENLLLLYYDDPDLFVRFSETIKKVLLGYIDIFIEESGRSMSNFDHGFSFADDDSNLMTPEMYEMFGYPILKAVFDYVSPNPGDERYQHSDSAMGHLVPILSRLNLNGCNFGPTVTVEHIRKHLPNARIDGQLAPFTFMSNDEDKIIAEVRRDCDMIRASGTRGLNISTAGSINNGSLLTSMRAVMAAIQNYGRY
jgi:uroporphyrinogen decarboxylase